MRLTGCERHASHNPFGIAIVKVFSRVPGQKPALKDLFGEKGQLKGRKLLRLYRPN
jgi:hypothetical protein